MKYFVFLITTMVSQAIFAQGKYQSLLWEISGNGLSRPSYVFGTMHVSNKIAFNLSDSFYYALRNVDAVALELNPETWQDDMVKMDKVKENFASYVTPIGNEYLNINSFRILDYVPVLKQALRTEPSTVNSLLYRSYKAREDFEEDTFLDLYIYQTGRKLGKKAAGLEDYYESEKLVLEAYGDMAREKKKRVIDLDAQAVRNVMEQVQTAYRKGDLDMLDSLDNLMERSEAFREKFLYKRNEIQADAIHNIIKNTSLFAGVGAAHLPGERGVVELLRARGYKVRPVKMTDRDARQKAGIDKLKVPVIFKQQSSSDGFISFEAPGTLYKTDNVNGASRWQYADMNNGSYYMITRLKTYGNILSIQQQQVLETLDSLLYENIPGNILSKEKIKDNKYPGLIIKAKTRRGDVQRYMIRATPYEVIIFKASGPGDYIDGEEGSRFFNSVVFNDQSSQTAFSRGSLSIEINATPHVFYNEKEGRWEYEITDSTGSLLVLKKNMVNFDHLDEDTFYLSMMEHSFHDPEIFVSESGGEYLRFHRNPALQYVIKNKDSTRISVLHFLRGSDYYTIAGSGRFKNFDQLVKFNTWFNNGSVYNDTILKFSVKPPGQPNVDEALRAIVESNAQAAFNGENPSGYFSYWPRPRYAVFGSDTTSRIMVKAQQFPVYFSIKDSVRYWETEMKNLVEKNSLLISYAKSLHTPTHRGWIIQLSDTGTSRIIQKAILLNGNQKYEITSITDSANHSAFNDFLESFRPFSPSSNIYESRLPAFFKDLTGVDSVARSRARQSIKNIYYGPEGLPLLLDAMNRISILDRDYFEIKSALINELGFINDPSGSVVSSLKMIYESVGDTIMFQNEVIGALARLKTKVSFELLKNLMVDDPPIFENAYEYHSLFRNFADTASLSSDLFPEILQLLPLSEYKSHILDLLGTLQDSGFSLQKTYQPYLPQILLEAKVSIKKLRHRDNRIREKELETKEEPGRIFNYTGNDDIMSQALLLLPFYDKDKEVRNFFRETLESLDPLTRTHGAVLLLRAGKPVHDSILIELARDDRYRAMLYAKLNKYGLVHKFPGSFKNQELMARSFLVMENTYDKMDSLELLMKMPATFQNNRGVVYFYRYRIQKENEWKIGVSGLQPEDDNKISVNPTFVALTQTRINPAKDIRSQLYEELRKMIILSHSSGRNFFDTDEKYEMFD